jgi:hypothetical protein
MPDQGKNLQDELSGGQLLRDGAILCGVIGPLVMGSLYYNAEIWLQDYPPDVRAAYGPARRPGTRRQQILVAGPMVLLVLGWPVRSTLRRRAANGGRLSFAAAFLHAAGLLWLFNLFDAVVLDYLILTRMQPRFAILPGTAGMAGYHDMRLQAQAFLKGNVFALVAGLIIGWLTHRAPPEPPADRLS